jgi:homocysteine S-methyltransferase
VAITASYQATPAGFAARGLDEAQSRALIGKSVELARKAREAYLAENPHAGTLLVAGSVGPYGAYLADGSEYRGDYVRSAEEFTAFHRPRVEALLDAGADLLACETLPSFAEIKALAALLPSIPAPGRGSRLPCATASTSATARRCVRWSACWQTLRRLWRWALTASRWKTPPRR